MTLKQIEQSMATFRKSCVEQTGVDPILIDGVRRGEFPENDKKLKVRHSSIPSKYCFR